MSYTKIKVTIIYLLLFNFVMSQDTLHYSNSYSPEGTVILKDTIINRRLPLFYIDKYTHQSVSGIVKTKAKNNNTRISYVLNGIVYYQVQFFSKSKIRFEINKVCSNPFR